MKYLLYTYLLFLLAACTNEQMENDIQVEGKVSVSINLRAYTDNYALNKSESRIKSVRIYAFDGNILDKMEYAAIETNGDATITMKVKPSQNKAFYVIVNETAGTTPQLQAATTPTDVEQIQYLITDYFVGNVVTLPQTDDSYVLPMFGSKANVDATGDYPPASPLQIDIPVTRSVARVDVYFKKAAGNLKAMTINTADKLQLEQSAEGGYLATAQVASSKTDRREFAASSVITINDTFAAQPAYSFYVPEQTCPSSLQRLKLTLPIIQKAGQPVTYAPILLGETNLNAPDQLLKIERNKIYKVQCIFQKSEFISQTNVLDWDAEYTDADAFVPVMVEANCYLLKKEGNAIMIPVSQANKGVAGSIGATDNLTAELLWSDVKGATSGKGLAWDTPLTEITLVGTGANAMVKVVSGKVPGNAVVAVKKNGTIVWSWHIWVPELDPIANAITKSGVTFMNCNLGAMDNKSTEPIKSMGNIYQWGRKDLFPYKPGSLMANGGVTTNVYAADGSPVTFTQDRALTTVTIKQSVENPTIIYIINNWLQSGDITLWGNTGLKAAYDPCPPGWRIPTLAQLQVLGVGGIVNGNGYTTQFGFVPNVGYISNPLGYVKALCMYSSEAVNGISAKAIYNTITNTANTIGRGSGSAIRCVKDTGVR